MNLFCIFFIFFFNKSVKNSMGTPFDFSIESCLFFLSIEEYEEYIKKKEIWNSSFTYNEKTDIDFDDKKNDIIELDTFQKLEKELEMQFELQQELERQTEKENEKEKEIKLENDNNSTDIDNNTDISDTSIHISNKDDDTVMINPNLLTASQLQDIFFLIPIHIINSRITDISNKIYKLKGLEKIIFDKNLFNTLVAFNNEIHTGLKSELAISFAKLIVSQIPLKYFNKITI
jgi:hypothetical protein